MTEVTVNQTIHVSHHNSFVETEPNLSEYKVTGFNKTSFYAKKGDGIELRFDKKTMKSTGMTAGDTYVAYMNPDDYWEVARLRKEKEELMTYTLNRVQRLSLDKLKKLDEWLKDNK